MHEEYSANVDYMLKYGEMDHLSTYVAIGQMFKTMCVYADNGESIPEVTLYEGPFMATYIPDGDIEAYQMMHRIQADDELITYEGGDIGVDSPMAKAILRACIRHLTPGGGPKSGLRVHPTFDCDLE